MDRRKCIKLVGCASLLATSAGQNVVRAASDGMKAHDMMDHSMMDHSGMQMSSLDTSNLMALDKMPKNQVLQPLPLLKNQSRKQGLFKANLEAKAVKLTYADRKQTEIWAYNGQMPGPQIIAYEGDIVEITFKNSLLQPTTVHWHGLPVPPEQDGNPQDAVLPGHTRLYRFKLPENCAGTYWYHPHPHGYVSQQVAKGLAGSFIVKAKDDPLRDYGEQHWFISDLRLDKQAVIPQNTFTDWMNGREGQFVLINGQLQPRIALKTGERIRIWNACSARYLQLAIPGCRWIVVGRDGGLLEQPRPATDQLFIAPAERIEVIVEADKNQSMKLISHYYDRHKMMVSEPHDDLLLASIDVTVKPYQLPHILRKIDDLGPVLAKKNVEFSESEMAHHLMDSNPSEQMKMLKTMFKINGKTYEMDKIDLTSQLGQVEEWEIFNNSHMDHPFHLHGGQFLIIKRVQDGNISQEPYKAWHDTFNLKPYERVTFHVKHNEKGLRVFHCHILEHETLGMMANLKVI